MENGISGKKVVSISKEDRRREEKTTEARMEILVVLDIVKSICLDSLGDIQSAAKKYFATKEKVTPREMFRESEYKEYKRRMAIKNKQQGPQLVPKEPEIRLGGMALYAQLYEDEAPLNEAVEEFTQVFEEEKTNLRVLFEKFRHLAENCAEVEILGRVAMDLKSLHLASTPDSLEYIEKFKERLEEMFEQVPKG